VSYTLDYTGGVARGVEQQYALAEVERAPSRRDVSDGHRPGSHANILVLLEDLDGRGACYGYATIPDRLLLQIRPFGAQMHLRQEVCELARGENGRFVVRTTKGTHFSAGAIVIAAGVGSFQFRKLGLAGCEVFEGVHIHCRVSKVSDFANRRVIVFGGGDSALDWTLELANIASSVTLVHRRAEFRAAMASVATMRALAADGRIAYLEGIAQQFHELNGSLHGITVRCSDGREQLVDADSALVFFGLHPKLGPIAEWGLELERKALRVDTERFQTNIPGIFAVGDINTYPGK
jgi:thioredoxin reductase (NADPH)